MRYFKEEEFKCKCCGQVVLDLDFISMLDEARHIADIPFIINSGYRCPVHNKAVGSKPTSSHIKGCAVDIKVGGSRPRAKILSSLMKVGFNRIGIGKDFIHVDNDKDKPSQVIWLY